jgi:glutaredoxin
MPAAVFRERAPEPAPEGKLLEVQEVLAKAWRVGQDAGIEADNERSAAAAIAAAGGDAASNGPMITVDADSPAPTAATTATANAEPPAPTTTATAYAESPPPTATATASADPPTAITTGSADASPPAAMADASAAPSPTASASATGSADGPTAVAVAAAEVLTQGPAPVTVPPDASASDIHVLVYTASWCDVCKKAEAWMTRRGIPFEERDVTAYAGYQQELLQLNPGGGIPTFSVDGEVMVGFNPRWVLVMARKAQLKAAGALL